MAKEPIVKVGGTQLKRILSVGYSIANGRDADGRPTKSKRASGIRISKVADGGNDISGWTKSSAKSDRRKGSIEFLHPDGTKMKTLNWEEAFVTDYRIYHDAGGDHVVEEFTIMPRTIEFDGKKFDQGWEKDR